VELRVNAVQRLASG
jgi:hypothetical protein